MTDKTVEDRLDAYLGITDDTHEAERQGIEENELHQTETEEPVEDEASAETETEEVEEQEQATEPSYAADDQKVQLQDGSVVTVGELKRGSLREADYTRKSQELAGHRKELEARTALMNKNQVAIDLALEIATGSIPPAPDQSLMQTNFPAYWQQKAIHDARMEDVAKLLAAKRGMAAAQQAERDKARSDWELTEARRAAELLPELADKEKNKAFGNDIVAAVAKYGFTPDDVSGIGDHRFLLLAKDLIEYHKIVSNKPKAIEKTKGKPPLTPSKRQSGTNSSGSDLEKLRKSGGRDAAALDRLLDRFV